MGDLEIEIGDATLIDETLPPLWRNDDDGDPPSGGRPRSSPARGWMRIGLGLTELALLRAAARRRGPRMQRLLLAAGVVTGVTIVDAIAGAVADLRRRRAPPRLEIELIADGDDQGGTGLDAVEITETIVVNRPPDEVFRFWRNLENLPRFMHNVQSVEPIDHRRSRWRARSLAGRTVEWDAEIVDVQEGRLIAWRSLPGADVPNDGTVTFVPAQRNDSDGASDSAEVRVTLRYQPPGGRVSATLAKLFGKEPGQQVRADLRRFKQVLEAGEQR